MIGTTLAHYRITAALGAGGMGEVWRAIDTKLGREVALKLLPEGFAEDSERMARFEREAKLLASLNHPNIAHLYGLETVAIAANSRLGTQTSERSSDADAVLGWSGGNSEFRIQNSELPAAAPAAAGIITFLVMELVEGEDLFERIRRGPVPVDEAVPIALQIAEALEAAHEAGIVHRDLKPANIKLREDGAVKVLDFGLAKAWEREPGDADSSLSPTVTRHATLEGLILGTTAYMSPEQARGRKVDRRADIWAFGVVLWEMLTGRKLFEGETEPDVLAGVLTFEPDWSELEQRIPTGLVRVLRGCLARDPRQRFNSAHDVALLLVGETRGDLGGAKSTLSDVVGRRHPALAAALILAVGLVLGAVAAAIFSRADAGREVVRSSIVEPEMIVPSGVALSPDGRLLAFVVSRDDGNLLATRSLSQFEPVLLPGTEGAMCPFFSPDGQWLGYFTRTELRKVPASGGQARTVALLEGRVRFDPWSASSLPTADWSDDGTIVFSSGFWREPAHLPGLYTVPAAGGEPTPVTDLGGADLQHGWPRFTPNGRAIVFTASGEGPRNTHVDVVDRRSGARRRLQAQAANGRVLASGHVVFLDNFFSRLVAAPLDLQDLALTGPAIPLIEGLGTGSSQGYALSRSGTLVYLAPGLGESDSRLVRVGFDGSVASLVDRGGSWYQPRVSPDGRHLVVREVGDECRLWLYDLERRNLTTLTTSGDNHQPVWRRDGREVVYGRQDVGTDDRGLFRQVADGSFPPVLLLSGDDVGGSPSSSVPYPDSFSPGDRELLFERSSIATGSDLWVVPLSGGAPQPFLATPAFEGDGAFSPDGRWIAYVSDESGQQEVYVRSYPSRSGRRQISVAGGEWPLWSPDGRRLFYSQGRRLMAVEFAGEEGEAVVGLPQPILRDLDLGRGTCDILPAGDGLVVVQPSRRGVGEVRVVSSWVEELRDMVASGGAR